jgi:hypothetical protein
VGLIDEKTEGRKSRATVPLTNPLECHTIAQSQQNKFGLDFALSCKARVAVKNFRTNSEL